MVRFCYSSVFAFFLIAFLITGCKKEEFNTSPDFRLEFSTDTVSFDTIFQGIGSATQIFKVYNRSDEFVTVDRVSVIDSCPNPNYEPYRINVDGTPGPVVSDLEIGPNDSMFVFVEVTIDPNNLCSALETGSIEFMVNGNRQYLRLIAYGLDAIFYVADTIDADIPGSPPIKIVDETPGATITWTPDRPYVIYGYARIEEGQKLVVEPGTQVYFHQGSGLWIDEGASIEVGSLTGETVIFQGDRLEEFFDEEPGQWDRIWINGGPEINRFENVVIKNNFIGLQAEPSPFDTTVTNNLVDNGVILRNVAIRNNSIAGIFTRNYRIRGQNLAVSAGGQYNLLGTGLGQYEFAHCTFANNWSESTRQTPAVFLTNIYGLDSETIAAGDVVDSYFRNCIIHGNGLNELGYDFETGQGIEIDLDFEYTLIRMQEEDFLELDQSYFNENEGIFVGFDPGFVNFSDGDFRLREDAFVRFKGTDTGNLPTFDIVGTPYNSPRPLGCFEYSE